MRKLTCKKNYKTCNNWVENAYTTGLLIWAVSLAGILGGGAVLVCSRSALAS